MDRSIHILDQLIGYDNMPFSSLKAWYVLLFSAELQYLQLQRSLTSKYGSAVPSASESPALLEKLPEIN